MPIRAPVIINNGLLKIKPIADEASPEHAFNNDITIGMSAPPMRMVIVMPNRAVKVFSIKKLVNEGE